MIDPIERIDLFPLRIKLKRPFVISLGRVDYAENVVVKIETRSGLTGFGECCPFQTINGESMETALVVGRYLKDKLINLDPLDIEACIGRMDSIIYGNSSIKSAFDIALHDIAARSAGLPLFAFLGGKLKKTLITDYTVSFGNPEAMVAEALEIMNQGYPAIKIKVGGTLQEDLCRVREIRKAIRPDIPLRLDANQGWSLETAIGVLSELDGMNIEFCEEPIPRWDFMNLAKVRKASPVPIMADESCGDHHDLERMIALGACDYVNIKLGKSGGLYKALKMIRLAEQFEMRVQIGGFVESRLGFTASAHLALSSGCVSWCDFDTPLMLEEDPVIGGIRYGFGGVVEVPEGIGLGAGIEGKSLTKSPKGIRG
ncbi:MAG: dipeptide epimerase [Porphyromonadaceae bacterium]|nr:MAG: dipeptide epimerase [Porphyromonadaceae bacterium]